MEAQKPLELVEKLSIERECRRSHAGKETDRLMQQRSVIHGSAAITVRGTSRIGNETHLTENTSTASAECAPLTDVRVIHNGPADTGSKDPEVDTSEPSPQQKNYLPLLTAFENFQIERETRQQARKTFPRRIGG